MTDRVRQRLRRDRALIVYLRWLGGTRTHEEIGRSMGLSRATAQHLSLRGKAVYRWEVFTQAYDIDAVERAWAEVDRGVSTEGR